MEREETKESNPMEEIVDNLPENWFGDIEDIEYETDYEALKESKLPKATYSRAFLNFFKTNVPKSPNYNTEELERNGLMVPLAIIYFAIYIGLLVYFSYSSALDDSKRKFLSLGYQIIYY